MIRINEQFLQRQISKMYTNKTPDYLKENQPSDTEARCKSLIQKIKDDKTTVGIAGEVCMNSMVQHYRDIMKIQDKSDRKQSDMDIAKKMQ